jgi:modulator of FtsH protease HflK
MERNVQKTGLVNFIVLLAAGAAGVVLAWHSNTRAGLVGSAFFGVGFLVAVIGYFQMRLEEKERLEKMEYDEMTRGAGAGSLFESQGETFPAKTAREQFERFFTPAFTFVLFLAQGLGAYFLWRWLQQVMVMPPRQPAVALALFGVIALVLFLLGKYAANLARLENERLMRPGAGFLVFGAYVAFVIAVGIGLVLMGFAAADIYIARALVILLALLALESLLSVILEIYRPRVRGKLDRVVYESRLVGLLAQPEGIFSTAAQALDYQFGFKVSETWFYRFMERALAWLILLQFAILVLSSCFVFISPGEEGLIERFGRPVESRAILQPGLHLKLPWPFDKVYRYRTDEIQSLHVGMGPDEDHGNTILWTVAHEKEAFNVMVASREQVRTNNAVARTNAPAVERGVPVDLLTVGIPIQFQISDVRKWAYQHVDAARLLEKLATREVVKFFASVNLLNVMSAGRGAASAELQKLIQQRADEQELGVKIIFVGLEDIHPPVKVATAFENLVAVQQENEAKLLGARGAAERELILAEAQAQKEVREADARRLNRVAISAAEGNQFKHQLAAYQAAPDVYTTRHYLETFGKNATNARLYVITTTNTQDVVNLNLEDKISPRISDIPVPPAKK